MTIQKSTIQKQVKQLELSLWTILRSATEDPTTAELSTIWQALDGALLDLPIVAQLEMSSRAIAQMVDIFQVQAGLIFELLDVTATMDGPTMASDAFDRYVRQSMEIDFDDYIEPIESSERKIRDPRPLENEFYSHVQSVDKTVLIESLHEEIVALDSVEVVMSVAHEEDVLEWIVLIRSQLLQVNGAIEFHLLLAQIKLQWVELWLGLLLGGYRLSRKSELFDKPEDFYSLIDLWVGL